MDLKQLEQLEDKLRNDASVGAIYIETPSNPDLACVDIAAITDLASKYQVKTILDNTFASPYLQQGFRLGVDIVIHSTTKYLNGHGNMIGGVIIGRDREFMEGKVKEHVKLLGTMASPFDSWILNNGLKTLSLRMERHCDNAEKIARFLEDHPKISRVNYPGLTSHPDHSIALKQMKKAGGMLSFEVKGGLDAGKRMMSNIQFCSFAPTLGNVDTLILHPASMSHLRVAKEIRERIGITDGLIRLSVGIETVEDIISDLSQSLDKV
jgi:methionine-gamma-lyase